MFPAAEEGSSIIFPIRLNVGFPTLANILLFVDVAEGEVANQGIQESRKRPAVEERVGQRNEGGYCLCADSSNDGGDDRAVIIVVIKRMKSRFVR